MCLVRKWKIFSEPWSFAKLILITGVLDCASFELLPSYLVKYI
jgi:hypothetical protein